MPSFGVRPDLAAAGYPDRPAVPSRIRLVTRPPVLMRSTGLLLALEHRRRTGQGVLVEAAMVDAALNVSAEQIIEYSAYGSVPERTGNRGPTAAPQNLYRSADIDEFGRLDSWVAIAVATDDQWERLCCALGSPPWATDPRLSTKAGGAHTTVSSMSS